jgi:hypothetical protein
VGRCRHAKLLFPSEARADERNVNRVGGVGDVGSLGAALGLVSRVLGRFNWLHCSTSNASRVHVHAM